MLLILVWFGVAYAFSRMGQVGLPGRFVREAAIPLILAQAVMIGCLINSMRSNYQKIFAVFGFGLIIIFNLAQVNGGVYRSPDFFKSMIWFNNTDKQAADMIRSRTPGGAVIIANPTTPYLPIFAQRSIVFAPLDKISSPSALRNYAAEVGAHYVFIGPKTSADPDEKAYPFFTNFDAKTALLQAAVNGCDSIGGSIGRYSLYDLDSCSSKKLVRPK